MLYTWDITIPAGTTELSPVKQELKISRGVIVKVQIKFPSGSHGLVKVRLFKWTSQLWPLSAGEWITGDDEAVDAVEYYEFLKGPYRLDFKGCAPTTTFAHTVTIRIVILPKAVASFVPFMELLQQLLGRIFGPTKEED
jgi:hypothetical protein